MYCSEQMQDGDNSFLVKHSGYKKYSLLRYNAVQSAESQVTFRRNTFRFEE